MFQCSNGQMFQCFNVQMFKCQISNIKYQMSNTNQLNFCTSRVPLIIFSSGNNVQVLTPPPPPCPPPPLFHYPPPHCSAGVSVKRESSVGPTWMQMSFHYHPHTTRIFPLVNFIERWQTKLYTCPSPDIHFSSSSDIMFLV